MFSRHQLKRAAALTEEDPAQIGKCRRPHNRLGFAYQLAFVRLLNRFPRQQPFEVLDELVSFSAAQLGIEASLIDFYRKRQPTISEHQYRSLFVTSGCAISVTPKRRSWSSFCSRRPGVWSKPPPSMPRRGSFLRSSASSNLPSFGSPASLASSAPGRASTSSCGLPHRFRAVWRGCSMI